MRSFLLSTVFLLVTGHLVAQDFDWKGDGGSLLKKCSLAVRSAAANNVRRKLFLTQEAGHCGSSQILDR
jgi:hypothetical protein